MDRTVHLDSTINITSFLMNDGMNSNKADAQGDNCDEILSAETPFLWRPSISWESHLSDSVRTQDGKTKQISSIYLLVIQKSKTDNYIVLCS